MKNLLITSAVVAACITYLFWPALAKPELTVFSNDGPLGALMAEQCQPPATASGIWQDLNWLGGEQPHHVNASAGFRIATQTENIVKLGVAVAFGLCCARLGVKRTCAAVAGVLGAACLATGAAGLLGFISADAADSIAPLLPVSLLAFVFLYIVISTIEDREERNQNQ